MRYKTLKINGAVLSINQLEDYLKKIAINHTLKDKTDKQTYPIKRLEDNFHFISLVYKMLNEHIKLKIPIHPAGEWLLDNFYIIEENVKMIKKELSLNKYTNFLGLANGPYEGFARIYVLASEIVAYTDSKISENNLEILLKAYENKKTLSMDEIWNISIFLKIALIENIREVCEKIYVSQIQKYKVENIIERLVENKEKNEIQFNNLSKYKIKIKKIQDMRYPFIEYMSYKLKQYGKKAYPFLNILEDAVSKMGTEITDVIDKEHLDIAEKKVTMGNCITSIKNLNRINMITIFERINSVEEILKQDPTGAYDKMDYSTKIYYRNKIKEISNKTKISEIYIVKKCLELSNIEFIKNNENKDNKKAHIGYYLISDGIEKLFNSLQVKCNKKISNDTKVKIYIFIIYFLTIAISLLISTSVFMKTNSIVFGFLSLLFLMIPIENSMTQIIQYILAKTIPVTKIPKIDMSNGVPEKSATFVVVPTILKTKEKVKELMEKLEVSYIANKSDNIYFALLGDCSSSSSKEEKSDIDVIKEGIDLTQKLNKKYPDSKFPKFHFIFRNRIWNPGEETYLGWERKRGLLNQFNEYILGNIKNPFRVNTIDELDKMPNIKYIITLDSDTDLILNSGLELIGAMEHILNRPELNEKRDRVISGYGIMQPRIGIDLLSCSKSKYTKIFAGSGGIDVYANAISDTYQDVFGEGIFTGKGIYNLNIFSKVLNNEIPEKRVLSHDLLEGNYLRCGLLTDVFLMDGCPTGYNSAKSRLHRWIRGDWQLITWLKKKIRDRKGVLKYNPLNLLCKYKIFDNLLRSLLEPSIIAGIIFTCIIEIILKTNIYPLLFGILLPIFVPIILDILNNLLFKKCKIVKQKAFSHNINPFKANLLRCILNFSVIPDKAYMSLNAITKTIYRLRISKKHLLEWVTAEEAEKLSKNDIFSYYLNMIPNVILGFLGLIYLNITSNIPVKVIAFTVSFLWIIAPMIQWYIGKIEPEKYAIDSLTEKEKDHTIEIAKKTWQFFKDNLNSKNNYLPPDNYQEDRKLKYVDRTSSTNIGLAMVSVISSYDLKFENLEETINLLKNMIDVIYCLPKWNGHLYNWYNIKTLEPLLPKYISSVDSGNFVGYLYIVKQFFIENGYEDNRIDEIIENTDFSKLYDEKSRLFSVGYNEQEGKLSDSYYDLLASEARQTSLLAIAKKDIPLKHWYNLSRTLTTFNRYKGLISWAGTSFEYLMPQVNMPKYPGSLIDESCKFLIMCQKEYNQKLNLPWGISESAFNLKDLNNNYQYRSFGIPWLGLKRGLADDIVVSPYASIIAITDVPKDVLKNLKILEKEGLNNKYGFYESIDYTPTRMRKNETKALVKTYMAHHQALILLSINNLINKNIIQKRFMANPEIKSVDILLQEKMPDNILVTKEQKEKIEKIKYKDYENYTQREYTKINNKLNNINVIGNDKYNVILDQRGNGYSKYKDVLINRFKVTDDEEQGIRFFFKNVKSKRIWTSNYTSFLPKADKYSITFTPDMNKIVRQDGNIETIERITVAPTEPVEIRRVELVNQGLEDETIEITSFLEPVLSKTQEDYAHKAFNKLSLSYEFIEETNTILVKRKEKNGQNIFLAVNLFSENDDNRNIEIETDKENFYGRGNIGIPRTVENSNSLDKNIKFTTDPIVAIKKIIEIKKNERTFLNLIIAISESKEEVLEYVEQYINPENIKRSFELAKAKVEAESRYLCVKGEEIDLYQKILGYLIFPNPLKSLINKNKAINYAPTEMLWKYGISGDWPILVVKIKNICDLEILSKAISAYEYFRVKNMKIDLVLINEEKHSYESLVKEGITNVILNKNIGYLLNTNGGIFVLNNLKKQEKEIIEARANMVLDCSLGKLERQIEDLEEEYIDNYTVIGNENKLDNMNREIVIKEKLNENQLLFFNEYGGFSEDGKEYLIKVNKEEKTPAVWSHVLANETFGTIVTENMGGYTWYKNSRLNRLTAWSNSQVEDIPSEIIYLKDMDTQKVWSLGQNPMPDDNDYYITYGFGYAKYMHKSNGIVQKLDVFVPKSDSVKLNLIRLENMNTKKKTIKLVYYTKPVLDEDELKSNGYILLEYNEKMNGIYAKNIINSEFKNTLFISSSEKINSYTGSKDFFIGNGNISNPDGINKIELDKSNSLWKNGIIAIELKVELDALESKEICLALGTGDNIMDCQDKTYKYSDIEKVKEEYANVKKYWEETINSVQVKTPIQSINTLMNGWCIYQTLVSRLWARSGYYQSGGAFGFRDQLQDTIALKYIDTELMKKQILKHSEHQFIEGDVEHWWHEETQKGVRTRFSDDLLWLPYITLDYINFTNDYTFLDIETKYLDGEILEKGIDEKYEKYSQSETKENIYNHCKRSIEKSINFGENGLPKIGSGDWNDGFSQVGNKGRGESVWLGFFFYDVVNRFIPICEYKNEIDIANKYKEILEKLKKSLNSVGWDGRWYRRAFSDEGHILGTLQNEECKIDSISQSWAVISNAGDNDKKYIAMESLENHLIDKNNGIIKLLDPPFEKSVIEPGYIKRYLPGTRENGGQYTHAACWTIIAEAILGFGEKATEFLKMINPLEHSKTKEAINKYKVEPYVIPADIYGKGSLAGRGGWTWYTGSSSWFYEAGLKYILGFNIEKGELRIKPNIPDEWKEYEIKYKYGNSLYNIKVKNNQKNKENKEQRFIVNGKEIREKKIKLNKDGGIYNIDVEV